MIDGVELFAGVKRESNFGHLIVCGLGGIFIEILNDFSSGLAPLTKAESLDMIRSLQGYKVFQGVRGREGVNEELFSEIIQRLSLLVEIAPEIVEMDMNPLMGEANSVVAVDTRVRVLRQSEN
jgi:acetyltransferase